MKRQTTLSPNSKKTKYNQVMNSTKMIELAMSKQVDEDALVFGSNSSTTSLNGISCPQEILSSILDYAPVETLQQAKLVNRNFYELAVMDKHYEKAMLEEFPFYSRRLKHLNEFKGLMMKLLKRRFVSKKDDSRLERLFWWIVNNSERSDKKVEQIIVDNALLDMIDRIETKYYAVLNKLVEIGRDNDMDDFEDDGGMYNVNFIISEGEEFYNRICADPESAPTDDYFENYMYPFNKGTYIPEDEDETELETVYKALSEGYDAFKKLDL